MLSIIAAVAKNNVIGRNNSLPWHIPEDLKRFKQLTTGHTIIMGRATFNSLGRLLPNRKHVVLSKTLDKNQQNVEVVRNIEELEKYIQSEEENFVIGGAEVYKALIPYANKMYITQIKNEVEGDTYFPQINIKEWKIVSKEEGKNQEDVEYSYEFLVLEKI